MATGLIGRLAHGWWNTSPCFLGHWYMGQHSMRQTGRMGWSLVRQMMPGWSGGVVRFAGLRRVAAGGFAMAPVLGARSGGTRFGAVTAVTMARLAIPGVGVTPARLGEPNLRLAMRAAARASRPGAGVMTGWRTAGRSPGSGLMANSGATGTPALIGRVGDVASGAMGFNAAPAMVGSQQASPTAPQAGASVDPPVTRVARKQIGMPIHALAVLRRVVGQNGLNGVAGAVSAVGVQAAPGMSAVVRRAAASVRQNILGPQAPSAVMLAAGGGADNGGPVGGMAANMPAAPAGGGRSRLRGDVYLDGAKVGTWMESMIERQVGRPPVGPTGFDPRLSPMWGGATVSS